MFYPKVMGSPEAILRNEIALLKLGDGEDAGWGLLMDGTVAQRGGGCGCHGWKGGSG